MVLAGERYFAYRGCFGLGSGILLGDWTCCHSIDSFHFFGEKANGFSGPNANGFSGGFDLFVEDPHSLLVAGHRALGARDFQLLSARPLAFAHALEPETAVYDGACEARLSVSPRLRLRFANPREILDEVVAICDQF